MKIKTRTFVIVGIIIILLFVVYNSWAKSKKTCEPTSKENQNAKECNCLGIAAEGIGGGMTCRNPDDGENPCPCNNPEYGGGGIR